MLSKYYEQEGALVQHRFVLVAEHLVKEAEMFVDTKHPDGWYHPGKTGWYGEWNKAVPVRVELLGHARNIADDLAKNVEEEWSDFEVGIAPADAVPITLFEKK